MAQQSAAEPFGESEWLLPLMEIQRRMYEYVAPYPDLVSLAERNLLSNFLSSFIQIHRR